MHAALLVAGQVHHLGQHRRPLDGGLVRGVVSHVLVDPERGDAGQTVLVVGEAGRPGPDRAPQRVPGGPQLAGRALDRGVLTTQLTDRPGHRPVRQRPARTDQMWGLLDGHPDWAPGVRASPGALTPPDRHRDDPRHVVQRANSPATAHGDDPARRAAHQLPARGDRHGHAGRPALDVLDLDTVQAEQEVAADTVVSRGRWTPSRSSRRSGAWSPPILGDLDDPRVLDLTSLAPSSPASRHPYRKSEEPPNTSGPPCKEFTITPPTDAASWSPAPPGARHDPANHQTIKRRDDEPLLSR